MKIEMSKHMALLGKKVEDTVTGFKGVVTAVSFDLYGCVQAIVNPGKDKDGKLQEQCWFDIARLKAVSEKPVMTPPDFEYGEIARGEKGAAEKPMMKSLPKM
jgi:hypothetical protein